MLTNAVLSHIKRISAVCCGMMSGSAVILCWWCYAFSAYEPSSSSCYVSALDPLVFIVANDL